MTYPTASGRRLPRSSTIQADRIHALPAFRLPTRRYSRSSLTHWDPAATAVIICDMWDAHWCKRAEERVAALAPRIDDFVRRVRDDGALIIHAPSETLAFYEDAPQRRRAADAPAAIPPVPIRDRPLDPAHEARLPIDDSDGGCDDAPGAGSAFRRVWTRQVSSISIRPEDIVSDSGTEIYNTLSLLGISNVIMTGVHANQCVLGRSFGIRSLSALGFNVAIARDLTDAMYNPARRPFVSHDLGTELIIRHIERYWCPSFVSRDLTCS